MKERPSPMPAPAMSDAGLAAALFAIDPVGTGGVAVRAAWGPARDQWLAHLQAMLPGRAPVRRVPANVSDDRLLGGLDLAATLQAKRPIVERGLLAEADGGLVILSMAERLAPSTVAHLTTALDLGCVVVEREGIAARPSARLGLIAFDEGATEDEGVAPALLDRLAFHIGFAGSAAGDRPDVASERDAIESARQRLAEVTCAEEITAALCEAALALGIDSLRAPLLAIHVARACAALYGRRQVGDADAAIACRLVLAPRATRLPLDASPPAEENAPADEAPPADDSDDREAAPPEIDHALVDMILAAAKAAIPAQILANLESSRAGSQRKSTPGKAGALSRSPRRGRPAGVRRGEPRGRSKINVIETLRAAAPWQALRRAAVDRLPPMERRPARLEIRRDDFRITRFKQHAATTTIFVVDASGSSAANRLAEAKGAVELLLADCYVRRDEVALIAFRGRGAEIILPPTRSLVRAKRCLAGLPGGGATPLAAAIDLARLMAGSILRKGQSPVVVLLTDGKANMTRDGRPGAAEAEPEATAAARAFRVTGVRALVVDTSPRPRPSAEQVAANMGALYLPLPYAGSKQLSDAIQASVASAT